MPMRMTVSDVLVLFAGGWFALALPAAIGAARIEGRRAVPLVLALGPVAGVGYLLCRRHRDDVVLESYARTFRV
jgi:hypothetical protein